MTADNMSNKIEFVPFALEDRSLYQRLLSAEGERGCEFSFANLYLWDHQGFAYRHDHAILFSQYDRRSVYLDNSALQWIIDCKCKLLVSDIYESKALHGVFPKLFGAGISTVCMPVKLYELTAKKVFLTAVFRPPPLLTDTPQAAERCR